MQLLPPPVLCVPAHNVWLLILILIYFPFSWDLYLTSRRFASYPKYMYLARSRDIFCNQARCGLRRPDLSGLRGEHTYILRVRPSEITSARNKRGKIRIKTTPFHSDRMGEANPGLLPQQQQCCNTCDGSRLRAPDPGCGFILSLVQI
jgi:hypothetical protein